MNQDDQIPDTLRQPKFEHVCWQQQLRTSVARAQDRVGRILVLVGNLADEITGLGIDFVSIIEAADRGTKENPQDESNANE